MNFEQREKRARLDKLYAILDENPLNGAVNAQVKALLNQRLYVVKFESANYAGAGETCLVWAEDEDEAKCYAEPHAEEYYYDQDSDQYLEENGEDDGVCYAVITDAILLEGSEYAEYVEDPQQQQAYYQVVN